MVRRGNADCYLPDSTCAVTLPQQMKSDLDLAPATSGEVAHREEVKELTIIEHLQELRRAFLVIAAAAVIIATIASFVLTNWLLEWLTEPAHDSVENVKIVFTDPWVTGEPTSE